MIRLACALVTLAFLGFFDMAVAAMAVALVGVALGSLALYQLNAKADEVSDIGERAARSIRPGGTNEPPDG